ncbi:MAG TPA: DUF6268 family outer membrane beta-barrel protein [Desulfuromonadaceae bacterium]|jgi:hypothetical protein
MMRFRATTILLAIIFLCIFVSEGDCAEQTPGSVERDQPVAPPVRAWNSQLSVGLLPSADIRNIPASAGIIDNRFRLTRSFKPDGNLTLTVGAGYGLKVIDSTKAGLPEDLHSLFLELAAHYAIADRNFVMFKMFPGLYSDFKDIGGDDLRLPVLLLGGHSFDNGLTLVGGFAYRFGYHGSALIPALGFSYQPNERWRIDLVAPRPGVTYSASRQLRLFVAGDFASDEYELKDHSLGAKVIKYSDYKATGGVEYAPSTAVKLTGALGYAFDRRFDFYEGDRSRIRLDAAPFMKLSLDFGW